MDKGLIVFIVLASIASWAEDDFQKNQRLGRALAQRAI